MTKKKKKFKLDNETIATLCIMFVLLFFGFPTFAFGKLLFAPAFEFEKQYMAIILRIVAGINIVFFFYLTIYWIVIIIGSYVEDEIEKEKKRK